MSRWQLTAAEASRALVVFLGTSIVGTLLGGWLADRFGRRDVIRIGFTGATRVPDAVPARPQDRTWALALLVPLAVFIFMPTSVLVVLGQEYLPHRVGMASGVTLGLAVSVGGMWRRSWAAWGIGTAWIGSSLVLLAVLALAAIQTFSLPPVGRLDRAAADYEPRRPGSHGRWLRSGGSRFTVSAGRSLEQTAKFADGRFYAFSGQRPIKWPLRGSVLMGFDCQNR